MSKIIELQETFLSLHDNPYWKFIMSEGSVFKPDNKSLELISKYDEIMFSIQIKSCFRNSLLTALHFDDLEYYEGWYLTNGISIPFDHAFNVKDGFVVDFTATKFKIKVDEYFGVKLSREFLEEYVDTDQYLTPLQYYFRKNFKKT